MEHPEAVEGRLALFCRLLEERAVPLGFVASSDVGRLRERHVDDSLRALACIPEGPGRIADIGSGAGLPGIPIAIARPDARVTLIEARRPRVAFLELAVESLGLTNARVVHALAERSGIRAGVCLARAVGDAAGSWRLAEPLLASGGCLVYFAGASWSERDVGNVEALGVRVETCSPASFSWQGPLVRMARRP